MKKKITLTALLAAVLVFPAGCQKDGAAEGSGSRTGNTDGFTATILQKGETDLYSKCGVENLCPATDTKTYLTGEDRVAWSAEDKILVKGATSQTMTVLSFGTDATTAMLSGTAPEPATSGRKYTGFYPATSGWWDTATKLVTLPAERTYNAVSPLDCVPMYAESDTKRLEFKLLFGLFEFTLTGDKKVNSIKIIAGNSDATKKNISGTFGMNATGNAEYKENGVDSAVVRFNGGIVPGPGVTAYIALPAGTYDSLTVVIRTDATDTWGGIYSKVLAPTGGIVINSCGLYATRLNTSVWDGVQMWFGGPYWAARNLGATRSSTDATSWYGDYYSWGATVLQYSQIVGTAFTFKDAAPEYGKYPLWAPSAYFSSDYRNTPYCNSTAPKFTKYVNTRDAATYWGGTGSADNKTTIDLSDDVAHVVLGGGWRMPVGGPIANGGEFNKLHVACGGTAGGTTASANEVWYSGADASNSYKGITGLAGRLFKANGTDANYKGTGLELFIPAAGYGYGASLVYVGTQGYYYSSSLFATRSRSVYSLKFDSGTVDPQNNSRRRYGFPVRALMDL